MFLFVSSCLFRCCFRWRSFSGSSFLQRPVAGSRGYSVNIHPGHCLGLAAAELAPAFAARDQDIHRDAPRPSVGLAEA